MSSTPSWTAPLAARSSVNGKQVDRGLESQLTGAISGDEQYLFDIDRVIRSLRTDRPLHRWLAVENFQPGAMSQGIICHHPDAEEVLQQCRLRHPDSAAFGDQTIAVIVHRLLQDRKTAAIWQQMDRQPLATIKRVLGRIEALAPHGCTDDACWVWCELIRLHPKITDYHYEDWQIRLAWKWVNEARHRSDHTGAGGPWSALRKHRKAALQLLIASLQQPLSDLEALDIDDYDSYEGTIVLANVIEGQCWPVPGVARTAVDHWVHVRGDEAGRLFDYPSLSEHWEHAFSEQSRFVVESIADRNPAPDCRLEVEDLAERLCDGQKAAVCCYVADALASCGDWSREFSTQLEVQCAQSLTTLPAPTKQARYRFRQKLRSRMDRIDPSDREAPADPSKFGRR